MLWTQIGCVVVMRGDSASLLIALAGLPAGAGWKKKKTGSVVLTWPFQRVAGPPASIKICVTEYE